MQCSYYDAGLCRSCTIIETPYPAQLAEKDRRVRELLPLATGSAWLPPVPSPESRYRNKAKMVVGGSAASPTLGILDEQGRGIDLRECGICSPGIVAALPHISNLITAARITPYDVPSRRGELKYVLATESPDGELMIRFVLRSALLLQAIREELPTLQRALPAIRVVSVNLQPEHKAIIEGAEEIALTDQQTLSMRLGGIDLHLRPQSFFQTNTTVAGELYAQAREWVRELSPRSTWDLYCGVGGFALHVAAPGTPVTGIEISGDAIASARSSAAEAGLDDVRFEVGDATQFALSAPQAPELVIVNPPRRGIGAELAQWLEKSDVRHVIYSSCNPVTLAKDLAAMPSFTVSAARVLDMFPQTMHLEAITLLERTA